MMQLKEQDVIERITIDRYYKEFSHLPVVDVRSPGEYVKGHVPRAHNIALFDNEERAKVGTVYKQQSKEKAIELGYEFVTPKLQWFIDEAEQVAPDRNIVVHCWRGGMRSESFANHLHDNGFKKVYIIEKGYKAFRHHVLSFFEQKFTLKVLGGYTGSGKTDILKELKRLGEQVVDLEGLAHHKGSAFGWIGEKEQPTVEAFENTLFEELRLMDLSKTIWVEDESLNIGKVVIPRPFFNQMREQQVIFLDIPVEERAKYLVGVYGVDGIEALKESVMKIQKRFGYDNAKKAIEALEKGELETVALMTLKYYDKSYLRGVSTRNQERVKTIKLGTVNAKKNAKEILESIE